MDCEHFPLLDGLDWPAPIRDNYCRLTHPDHPQHAQYRADVESLAKEGRISRGDGVVRTRTPRLEPAPPPSATEDPVGPTAAPTPDPVRFSAEFARYQERHLLVLGCDYRGEQVQGIGGCGCTKTWHCARGSGTFASNRFEASYGECLECVTAKPSTTLGSD